VVGLERSGWQAQCQHIADGRGKNQMNELTQAMADLDDQKVMQLLNKQLSAGTAPVQILDDLRRGMDIVGDKFSKN
jgi:methanogenic corrinoid protein MtbC1